MVDFGLVKELSRNQDQSATDGIAGTPAYIAPEAVTDPDRVGPRSDLYALGAVGYFLLTGQRVFAGKSSVDLYLQHVGTAPPPPSTRTSNPVPPELEALILQCLAKDPAGRPADARALAAALQALAVAHPWDEDAALAWWQAFEARRPVHRPGAPAGTITVDAIGRAAAFAAETESRPS